MTLKEQFKTKVSINTDAEAGRYATQCEQIADGYAIKFALFLSTECETSGSRDGWWFYKEHWKTTDEMLKAFKEDKGL